MTSPPAPGRLGVAIETVQLYQYLALVTEWVTATRNELDALDAEIMDRQANLTNDMMLGLSLWQEASNRVQEILAIWDSGRADQAARQRISGVIWGADSGKNLPETGQLLDLVITKIRQQLGLEAGSSDHLVRLNRLIAQFERIGLSITSIEPTEPIWIKLGALQDRLNSLLAQRERGGDIAGPLASLETDATVLERDAIVATSVAQPARSAPPDPRIEVYQQVVAVQEALINVPGTPQPILNSVAALLASMKTWING